MHITMWITTYCYYTNSFLIGNFLPVWEGSSQTLEFCCLLSSYLYINNTPGLCCFQWFADDTKLTLTIFSPIDTQLIISYKTTWIWLYNLMINWLLRYFRQRTIMHAATLFYFKMTLAYLLMINQSVIILQSLLSRQIYH